MAPPADPARSFGSAAEQYETSRPTYPAAAVRWVTGRRRVRVLDLGAGTGKLTAVALACGHDVTAVEPDDRMRARLTAGLAGEGADVMAGSAEAIPLPDGSVDAVVAGQAYHWFDRPRALPEIARVLAPKGRLGLLWNVRDESVPWVADLTRLLAGSGDGHSNGHGTTGDDRPWFRPYALRRFRHEQVLDADGLVTLLSSRSYFITAEPEHRDAVLDDVRSFTRTHPALRGRDRFVLPYVTLVYRAGKAAASPRS